MALRERIQFLLKGEAAPEPEEAPITQVARPFIQKTLQAITTGKLKPEEHAELLRALENYQAGPTEAEESDQ